MKPAPPSSCSPPSIPLGTVYLLGAGPGAGEYLTVLGRDRLAKADVVIYDALTDSTLRAWTPPTCEWICVGKRGGEPSTAQGVINQLLVHHCRLGQQVVRLKSGDPFIFGRALAEIEALRSAECSFEVIPGLSSALVAPLLAGIPLTDPVLSQGFGVYSAHDPDQLNWGLLAQMETLVLLMGGRYLDLICHQLLLRGRSPETPMAIIRWASQPEQQVWSGSIGSLPQQLKGETLSPCVMVIGSVVALRDFIVPGGAEL